MRHPNFSVDEFQLCRRHNLNFTLVYNTLGAIYYIGRAGLPKSRKREEQMLANQKKPKRFAVFAGIVIASLWLAGCAVSTEQNDESSSIENEESFAAEIVIAVTAEPVNLNPGMVGHNEANTPGMRNVFEALVQRSAATAELFPGLATSWQKVDELTWEFELRQGVVFHDGQVFNAEAAAKSLNWLHDPDLPETVRGQTGTSYGGPQLTAEAAEEYLLRVRTEEPDPILPSRMLFFMMFSPSGFEDESQLVDNPVGTGPYRFVEWARGSHVELEVFPEWWGNNSADSAGEVYFTTARFAFRNEDAVRMNMIQAGEADIAVNLSPEDCALLNNSGQACISVGASETIVTQVDVYNPASMFQDSRVRAAFNRAIDTESILEAILSGTAVPASQMVSSTILGYNGDLEPYPYDPELARELLAEYVAEGGELQTISWWYQLDRFPRVAEYVQAAAFQLEQVGFVVEVSGQEAGVAQGEAWPPNFPANRVRTHTHGNNIGDLSQTASIYFKEPAGDGGIGLWGRDQELFDLVVGGTSLLGAERKDYWENVARYVHEQDYFHYGGYLAFNYGLSDRVEWTPDADHFYLLIQMTARN